jgi:hypothetical protein
MDGHPIKQGGLVALAGQVLFGACGYESYSDFFRLRSASRQSVIYLFEGLPGPRYTVM